MNCLDCIEWEYFEWYGYGCFAMKTMTPLDANECEFYADKRENVPHSWKPHKGVLEQLGEEQKTLLDTTKAWSDCIAKHGDIY